MTTVRWRGDAPAVAQVSTVQVTAYAVGTTYLLTINGKSITTIAAGSVNATATALAAAWNASSIPEFSEVTASATTDTVTLTADTAGKPFIVSKSVSGSTGTMGSVTAVTASAGPNDWSTALNWSAGAVPVSTDDVYIENTSVDILYGLDQNAVTLTSLNIALSYTGKIGLPDYSTSGGSTYYEYRVKSLTISATACKIGYGDGQGSGRIRINLGSNASAVYVSGTGSSADQGIPALLIQGSHASNTLDATQGTIGLAIGVGETAQFPIIRIGSESSPSTDVTLISGSGVTLGTIKQSGGNVTVASAVTTWTKTGGNSTQTDTATLGTLTQDGQATHFWQSSGTLTAGTIRGEQSVLDCSRDLRTRTATNLTVTGGAQLLDPFKTITFSNAFATDAKSLAVANLGNSPFSLQRS